MKIRFLLFLFFVFAVPSFSLIAQTKAQAETALKSMTPEEIDKKLKEIGITRDEAIARASALNINLEEYLSKFQAIPGSSKDMYEKRISIEPSSNLIVMPSTSPPSRLETDIEKKDTLIPGFTGRISSSLKPFGYNIFQYSGSTFEPVLNMATPPSYALGPGDEITVSMWGDTKLLYQLQVNREGSILVPEVGPISASGMTIQQLREKMLRRMTAVYSSLRNGENSATSFLDISLGKLRTIQVFVLGEVKKPGGYSLSSLSTTIHALYLSGGPTINGSLRSIRIIRSGKVEGKFDFYDYALRADKSKDIRLQDGDIVFVKTAGKRVGITGFIVRPAVYELGESENLGDLIELSGGLRFDAYIDRIHIERIVPFEERKNYLNNFLDYDLRFTERKEIEKSKFEMKNGDVVTILQVGLIPENRVTITGNVKKPGVFELKPGMHIRDLILAADSLDRNTFSERGTLIRLLSNLRREVIPFNPRYALLSEEKNNIELKNEDSLIIYKESQFFPPHTVSIGGAIRNPGTYPRHDSMTVADLVVMAGGLNENASKTNWELARLDTTNIGTLSKIFKFDAPEAYWQKILNSIRLLEDYDHLMVPSNPKFNPMRVVVISGYSYYPSAYALVYEGEKLSSVIHRAGGLRPGAYLEGSTLFRKWNNAGLVPINFEKAIDDTQSTDNISLLAGDSINISFKQDVILVRGEVFVPSAIVYSKGASLEYYINQAGGLKEEADNEKIYVSLPNGKKWERSWFLLPDPDILGGSVISVPKKIEKEDKTLPIMRDWATIMLSLATLIIGIVQITK